VCANRKPVCRFYNIHKNAQTHCKASPSHICIWWMLYTRHHPRYQWNTYPIFILSTNSTCNCIWQANRGMGNSCRFYEPGFRIYSLLVTHASVSYVLIVKMRPIIGEFARSDGPILMFLGPLISTFWKLLIQWILGDGDLTISRAVRMCLRLHTQTAAESNHPQILRVQRGKWQEGEIGRSPAYTGDVQNAWNCSSAPSIHFRVGMLQWRRNFSFAFASWKQLFEEYSVRFFFRQNSCFFLIRYTGCTRIRHTILKIYCDQMNGNITSQFLAEHLSTLQDFLQVFNMAATGFAADIRTIF
jgi:hypothetical protein